MFIVGLIGGIFQFQPLMTDVPDVAVPAVAVAGIKGKVNAVRLAVGDFVFPGFHGPYIRHSPGSDDLQVGSQSLNAQFKADLVVALACGSVAYSCGSLFSGDLHQLFGDGGTGHGGAQQVFVLIDGTGLDAGHDVVLAEFIHDVLYVQFGSSGQLCSLFQPVQFAALSAVYAAADHFVIEIFLQPWDQSRGVQSAGIGKYNFFFHPLISS